MMDPAAIQHGVEAIIGRLDEASKDLAHAHEEMNAAEAAWLASYDLIAEELVDQMAQEGRRGSPAEHAIISTARRRYPEVHRAWRQARRRVEMLEKLSQNRRSELSGYQTLLRTADSEAGAQDQVGQGRGLPQHARQRYAA